MQRAFAADVGGEPVAAVDLLAPGHEGRMEILLALPGVVGDHAAVGDDDLEVAVVDPDAAFEVAMVLEDLAGADVEDVAGDLVDLLAAGVNDVVGGDAGGGEDEGEAVLDVLEVGG